MNPAAAYLDDQHVDDPDVLNVSVLVELLTQLGTALLLGLGKVIVHH